MFPAPLDAVGDRNTEWAARALRRMEWFMLGIPVWRDVARSM
jgi:hypothetical protein